MYSAEPLMLQNQLLQKAESRVETETGASQAVVPAPLVTVYIPTRNRPELLDRAVQSCLSQSYKLFELIIVDDCSDEHYRAQIEAIACSDPRIRLLTTDSASGACVARNLAIQSAKGVFITGLDDDDEFLPGRLQHFVQEWQKHPEAAFLCTGYQVVTPTLTFSYGRREEKLTASDLLWRNAVGNQLFTRTDYLRQITGFDPAFLSCQDYDCWIRLSQRFGKGRRLTGCSYRIWQDHSSDRISVSKHREQGYQLLLERHGHVMNRAQRRAQKFYWYLNTQHWQSLRLVLLSGRYTFSVALKNILMRHLPVLVFLAGGHRR
ncbi:glycosyltransferase [Rheinheimera sp.]|uniref:glycosyltransferase n=1 Tax=Rheinheimera sp. TaxID=1869214 RepID=UPI00307FCA2F